MKTRMAALSRMFGAVAVIVVMSFALPAAAQVVLDPTRFVEGVSMGKGAGSGQHVSGADDEAAESITLDFSNASTPPGTHGVATATTSNILPLLAQSTVDAVDNTDLFGGSAAADIDFSFTIDALEPGFVDVEISTAGAVTVDLTVGPPGTSGSAQASATLQIFHGASFVPGANWAASKSCAVQPDLSVGCMSNTGESFDDTLSATLQVGEVYTGQMRTLVHGQGGGDGFSFHGDAWVDPTIVLAAGFDPALYQIRFSPGIEAASNVIPVPAALPLLLSGLAGLGLIGWRRRQAV